MRLEFTANDVVVERIRLAADKDGRSVSNFLRQAAIEKSTLILGEVRSSASSELVGTTEDAVQEVPEKLPAAPAVAKPAPQQEFDTVLSKLGLSEQSQPEESEEDYNIRMENEAPFGKYWNAQGDRYENFDWNQ